MPFGPGAPGAIYRLDLKTLKTTTFATIPHAGTDPHQSRMDQPDAKMIAAVGKMSIGGLEFNRERTELYAMNLLERKIYRLSFPGGQLDRRFHTRRPISAQTTGTAALFWLSYHIA